MRAKSKHSEENKPREQQKEPNLGQKEAKQQERSDSELSQMGHGNRSKNEDNKT